MKKILLSLAAVSLLFSACENFNSQFEGIDELAAPTNLAKYNYTLEDGDYKTISDRALKIAVNAEDSAKARSINTNKYFSATVPASNYVGLLLDTKFPYGDYLTNANITYTLGQSSPSFSVLNTADYQYVWNDPYWYVEALTPATAPDIKMNSILKNKFPAAVTGEYRFIEFNYSSTEASIKSVDSSYFFDDFESHTYLPSPYSPISENGWMQKDTALGSVKGIYRNRLFNLNHYAQITSNATNEKNDAFLITKQLDLTLATNPKLKFDVNVGYWNATCLQVLVSENFDGNVANIGTATWNDVSSSFTFPVIPVGAYGVLAPAGVANLTLYAGKKVYVAFKYTGDSRTATVTKITTTYQIDNFNVCKSTEGLTIPSSEKQYLAYNFDGANWVKLANETFYVLTDTDYTSMGLTYISTTDLVNYIPNFLKVKYPYALEGASKNVVYKTSNGSNNATQFVLSGGVWSSNTFKKSKTEQFIFTADGWVFDPTINMEMVKSDYQIMVDYTLASATLSIYANPEFKNEEFYYGFGSRFSNVSFRLSYRNPYFFGKAYELPASTDTELFAKTTNEEKVALLWTRMEEAMNIFLQKRFPNAVPQVSGVDVFYNVKVKIYTPDGVTTTVNDNYIYKYQCTSAGSPATFVFVSKTKV